MSASLRQTASVSTHVLASMIVRRLRCSISAGAVVLLCMTGCSGFDRGVPSSSTSAKSSPFTMVVYGDSLTALASEHFSADTLDSRSWIKRAIAGTNYELVGGYAIGGATTSFLASKAVRSRADVTIVMAGTNDILDGVPPATTLSSLREIVARTGTASAIIVAAPPLRGRQTETAVLNGEMKREVMSMGWTWADPWGPIESGGEFIDQIAADGIHPNAEGQALVGAQMRQVIRGAWASEASRGAAK